jgi:hypothetical protein
MRTLAAAGVRIAPIGGATGTDARFTFPITGGRIDVDPLSGRIEHRGGLRIRAGGSEVTATDLVIRPARGVLTAEVSGRRVPLFSVDLRRRPDRATSTAVLAGPARLSADAIPGLPSGVPDVRIGRIVVSAVS